MTQVGTDTEALVSYLVRSLVDNPDAVVISQKEDGESLIFEVELDGDDVGKVIGRGGRIIKAIRTLARAAGNSAERQIDVEILG